MSPLEKGDHPELDDTPFLEADGIQDYQSVIGSAQWAISLGRLDIQTAVMTLSSFQSAPRIGHLERAKRVVRYLVRFKHGARTMNFLAVSLGFERAGAMLVDDDDTEGRHNVF
jgi:hypothetical protein